MTPEFAPTYETRRPRSPVKATNVQVAEFPDWAITIPPGVVFPEGRDLDGWN